MPDTPQPDEFGWFRVTDKDTGHKMSIRESQLAHGNYTVLKQPASDFNGDPVPVEYSTSETSTGQSAAPKKETTNG